MEFNRFAYKSTSYESKWAHRPMDRDAKQKGRRPGERDGQAAGGRDVRAGQACGQDGQDGQQQARAGSGHFFG